MQVFSLCCKADLRIITTENGEHYQCVHCLRPASGHAKVFLGGQDDDAGSENTT